MTQTTPFSLVYGLEATFPIEFEVESLRVAMDSRLTDSQSLKNKLTTPEELDERQRMSAQHIEAIQRRRKITFNKRHKTRTLRPSMMVLLQDARKFEFLGKFDAVWLGPYLIHEAFSQTTHCNWRHWMGRASQLAHPAVDARNIEHEVTITFKQEILDPSPDGRQLCEHKIVSTCLLNH